MDQRKLQVLNPKFFHRVNVEVDNITTYLQPIYNNTLKQCEKCLQLQSAMAQQCIPMMTDLKQSLEETGNLLEECLQTGLNLNQAMDEALKNSDNNAGK